MSKVTALHDKVVMKKVEKVQKEIGGIIIPDNAKEKSNQYEVVHVGPGMFDFHSGQRFPMEVQVGDIVVVPKAAASSVPAGDSEYFVCREVDILAIIKED